VVQIDADGNMFEGGAPMDRRSLGMRVLEKLKGAPDLQVRVEADQKLTYERVMAVIARLQELGVKNVGLATRQTTP
jgi:biopolymer transport protein ExbD